MEKGHSRFIAILLSLILLFTAMPAMAAFSWDKSNPNNADLNYQIDVIGFTGDPTQPIDSLRINGHSVTPIIEGNAAYITPQMLYSVAALDAIDAAASLGGFAVNVDLDGADASSLINLGDFMGLDLSLNDGATLSLSQTAGMGQQGAALDGGEGSLLLLFTLEKTDEAACVLSNGRIALDGENILPKELPNKAHTMKGRMFNIEREVPSSGGPTYGDDGFVYSKSVDTEPKHTGGLVPTYSGAMLFRLRGRNLRESFGDLLGEMKNRARDAFNKKTCSGSDMAFDVTLDGEHISTINVKNAKHWGDEVLSSLFDLKKAEQQPAYMPDANTANIPYQFFSSISHAPAAPAKSSDATLKALLVEMFKQDAWSEFPIYWDASCTEVAELSKECYKYYASCTDASYEGPKLTATPTDPHATVTGTNVCASTSDDGAVETYEITVTAEDGTTQKTYTVIVRKKVEEMDGGKD